MATEIVVPQTWWKIICTINYIEKKNNKEKEAVNSPILKKTKYVLKKQQNLRTFVEYFAREKTYVGLDIQL